MTHTCLCVTKSEGWCPPVATAIPLSSLLLSVVLRWGPAHSHLSFISPFCGRCSNVDLGHKGRGHAQVGTSQLGVGIRM